MTIAKCLQFCRNPSDPVMRFAGVHSRIYCLCGVNSTEYDRHGRVEDWRCDQPCEGNSMKYAEDMKQYPSMTVSHWYIGKLENIQCMNRQKSFNCNMSGGNRFRFAI